MRNVGDPADRAHPWSSGLWWAGPTALALLGASIVSLVLVPGPAQPTAVPQQVVVEQHRARPDPVDRPKDGRGGHVRPSRTADPDDDGDDDTVVTPYRAVESEPPDDDDLTATPTPRETRETHEPEDDDRSEPTVSATTAEPSDDGGSDDR